MISEEVAELVRESYGRCNLSKGFYDDFYTTFFSKSEEVKSKFRNTDLEKQKEALRYGLGFMILYSRKHHTAVRKIDEIAKIHDQQHHNIHPDLYPIWIDSLLEVVGKHDKDFTPELDEQWRQLLKVGIDRFLELY